MDKNILMSVLILIIILIFSSPVLAQNYSCYAGTNISRYYHNISITGNVTTIDFNETCKFGCNAETGKCNETEADLASVGIMFGLPLIALVFIYMANNITFNVVIKGYELNPLQYLFFALSFFMLMIDGGIFLRIARTSSQTGIHDMLIGGYAGIVWGWWVTIAVIMIYFIASVFMNVLRHSRKK